ncbi:Na(+)/H(+) exchange regulatory cofactor NHE-RF1 [Aplysia californica]|uniref:Na(+)/H(+) exchange regulatory cofactor NHE-RF1 n=1 Tax=Aplysia californica TaxID=6500 RepID=A0ABM0JLV2_APLCA|nr:Na(+)/H(+) exchange regulatory cofactor NHE-RF1 [Aplysia californica]
MSGDVPEEFRPRQCHVVKWPEFQGYGFNLHAEKGKAGQYIGKVDGNSPAEAAGLKEGDRIVEVNNVNIGNENHQQVVARVRSGGEETRLLVVDTNADNWYKEQKKVIKGDLPEVLFISAARNVEEPQVETVPEPVEVAQEPEPVPEPVVEPEPVPEPEPEPVVAAVVSSEPSNGVNGDTTHRPRLCHLRIWPHFQGYGFNLHAERDKPGQYIGLVDDDSPASTAGLKVNDRIVEVNGVNIEQQTHTEVISRIKEVPGQTRLLVVDREADQYFREKGVAVSSYLPETEFLSSADPNDVQGQPETVDLDQEVAVTPAPAAVAAAAVVVEQQAEEEVTFEMKEEEEEVAALVAAVDDLEVTNGQFAADDSDADDNDVVRAAEEDVTNEFNAVVEQAGLEVEEEEVSARVEVVQQEEEEEPALPPPPPIEYPIAVPEPLEPEPLEPEPLEPEPLEPEPLEPEPLEPEPLEPELSEPEQSEPEQLGLELMTPPPAVEVEAVNGEQPSEPEPAPEPEYTLASSEPTPQPQPSPTPVREEPAPPAPEPTPAPVSAPQPTTPAPAGTDALGMGLSVAEMKERLKAKKKQDPRLSKMSFEQKYKDFQRL